MRPDWCSAIARAEHVQLAGTAPPASGILLVEWPAPWPAQPTDIAALAPVAQALDEALSAGHPYRLQLIASSDPYRVGTRSRVALFTAAVAGAGGLAHVVDLDVPFEDVPSTAASLVNGAPTADAPQRATLEFFICTNGSRDVCCGSLGPPVIAAIDTGMRGRVWRTTHTGGHRFAPTGFTLPDGAFWGRLDDPPVAEAILRRDGPVAEVLDHFRGTTLSNHPALQVVERELLGIVGWEFLRLPRDAAVEEQQDGATRVRIRFIDGQNVAHQYEAMVIAGPETTIEGCRAGGSTTVDIRRTVTALAPA